MNTDRIVELLRTAHAKGPRAGQPFLEDEARRQVWFSLRSVWHHDQTAERAKLANAAEDARQALWQIQDKLKKSGLADAARFSAKLQRAISTMAELVAYVDGTPPGPKKAGRREGSISALVPGFTWILWTLAYRDIVGADLSTRDTKAEFVRFVVAVTGASARAVERDFDQDRRWSEQINTSLASDLSATG